MNQIGLDHIIEDTDKVLEEKLLAIKGIGSGIIDTILEERPYFIDDMITIFNMPNIIPVLYKQMNIKIKYSGIRDTELSKYLRSKGFESDDGSVTKDTTVLIVPSESYSSTKTKMANKYQIPILTYQEFTNNLESYITAFENQ